MKKTKKSSKLDNVCYDIRGPVLDKAHQMEEEGHQVIKLNIGNPAPFGFDAPEDILRDVIHHLPQSVGYSDSKGLYSARTAIMQQYQTLGVAHVAIDDIFLGNGVSELIVMSMQALLENKDEILIPAPDYPLWTAAVSLSGGKPMHYLCNEADNWYPDLKDIENKISPRTRGIVIINPNNPTGAVYPEALLKQIVKLAKKHDLIIFADEIYDKILYDSASHTCLASLCKNQLCVSFNGLSKSYRVAGFRAGWMLVSGAKDTARDYMDGLNMLASMRLCANVPAQNAIQTALGGYQSINDLVLPAGRLGKQRDLAWELLTNIPGVSCVKPKSALYLFIRLDPDTYPIDDDEQFALALLLQEKVLLVHGSAFNWPKNNHFRIVFLPTEDELREAIHRIADFLGRYRKQAKSKTTGET
ncbi:MAG: pyridoxal phosphate-dependent aminotransferase [Gammaproteobacteria bacterium]|nr:pyridoxal phosphate-dependent aminotransferase [Gammaproteobacteria bacterium]